MKKFLRGLLAILLVLVIAGGLGYIGYSYYYLNPGSMATSNVQATQDQQNMQHGTTSGQDQTMNASELEGVRVAMANKESLDAAIAALDEAMTYMTLDPYSPEKVDNMSGMNEAQTPQTATANTTVQGSTTINMYPSTNSTQQSNTTKMTMSDMGTVYDPAKMEQLHTGLYKLSVGMQLLGQLSNDLSTQAELAAIDMQNPTQYYSNQYVRLLQNKSKLSNSLTYINEASSLVNINPYVSEKGLVYDKDRMKKIHESIVKMAQGVVALNKLSDDMTMQSVNIASAAQNFTNNAHTAANMNSTDTSSGILNGLFSNMNVSTVINIILILFVTMFVLGLFGFIFSLLKTTTRNMNSKVNIMSEEQQ